MTTPSNLTAFEKEETAPAMKWCYSCGAQTIPKRWLGYWDAETGRRYQGYDYICPNKKWWQLFHREEQTYYDCDR